MSYYRNVYLKSDEWRTLRAAKLHSKKNKCQICGFVSKHNDVHHVKYKKLYDVSIKDLKVLCRSCHDKVHSLLDKYPKLKKLEIKEIWKITRDHLHKDERHRRALNKKESVPKRMRKKRWLGVHIFVHARAELTFLGIVFKSRMPWRDVLLDSPNLIDLIEPSEKFITMYEALTGINPRRFDFEPIQKPLALLENDAVHDYATAFS